jgi:hypothetical protein
VGLSIDTHGIDTLALENHHVAFCWFVKKYIAREDLSTVAQIDHGAVSNHHNNNAHV